MTRLNCLGILACLSLTICLKSSQAVISPTAVLGKEYSQFIDADFAGVPDSEQAVYWDGAGFALDTFDYTPGAPGPLRSPAIDVDRPETDALAFNRDYLFQEVRGNRVDLVFSTDMDGSIFYEDTPGAGGIWAAPATINMAFPPRDVDAIELWGPNSTAAGGGDDGFNYSLESRPPMGLGAFDPGAISVWHVPGSAPGALGPVAFPLLGVSEIATAIAPLAPAGTAVDFIQEQLDLDGMMLDIAEFEPSATGGVGVRRGRINFTIDPMIDPSTGGLIFDGGEIFTWDFAFPGPIMPAAFLSHGGHLWDTPFSVMATFGTATENVNGIEAVPEPASGLLLAVGMLLLVRRLSC